MEDDERCVTRLVGWPGNGTRMARFHVLTHHPGGAYVVGTCPISRESIVYRKGRGQVDLSRGSVDVGAGNFVYVSAAVEHAARATPGAREDFVVLF